METFEGMQIGISLSRQTSCAPAMSVSLTVHALLIFSLFHSLSHSDGRIGRRAGTVIAEHRLDVFLTAAEVNTERRVETTSISRPLTTPRIVSPHHSHALPPRAASKATDANPTAVAGSHFVSPFAPILSSPLGRAGWGAPPQPEPQQMQYWREQAHAQFRTALMERLATWVGRLAQQRQEASCMLRIGLDSRQAEVSCLPATFDAELWAALNGLVVAGTSGNAERVCLRAGMAQLGFVPCEEETVTSDPS